MINQVKSKILFKFYINFSNDYYNFNFNFQKGAIKGNA